VHAVFRLLGWSLLVAGLVGLFWPERPEPVSEASLGSSFHADSAVRSRCPNDPHCPPPREAGPLTEALIAGLPRLPG
jgi:hypothetical protein